VRRRDAKVRLENGELEILTESAAESSLPAMEQSATM